MNQLSLNSLLISLKNKRSNKQDSVIMHKKLGIITSILSFNLKMTRRLLTIKDTLSSKNSDFTVLNLSISILILLYQNFLKINQHVEQ